MMKKIHGFTVAPLLLCGAGLSIAQPQPGTVLWSYSAGGGGGAPTLAPDGTVYLSTGSGLCAITNNGSIASNKWKFPIASPGPSAIGSDGTIYVGSGDSSDGNLYAIRPDGVKRWSCYLRGGGACPAIGADGTVYYDAYAFLYAISPLGTTNWKVTIGDSANYSAATIGPDGTIYIGSPAVPTSDT